MVSIPEIFHCGDAYKTTAYIYLNYYHLLVESLVIVLRREAYS